MSLTQTLQGRASAWLLARPSHQTINRASLATAFAVSLSLLAAIIGLSLAQWILSEHLQLTRIEREQRLSLHADRSLKMAMAASNAHRATLSALLARDETELGDSLHRRHAALDEYDLALDSTDGKLSSETLKQKQTTAALAKNYRTLSSQLLELIQKGDLQQALEFRLAHLRPAFEKWQAAHDEFAQSQTHEILEKDAAQLQTIRILRRVLFALVLAPAALLVLGTLAVFAILGLGYLTRPAPATADPWSH
jgi:hypothetical protein